MVTVAFSGSARPWRDVSFVGRDGLRLHARHYPAAGGGRRPVLCLPGLTRNSRDFHDLALALSAPDAPRPRDVYTLDSRGRGLSDRDPDWRNYAVPVEATDALDFLTRMDLHGVTVIGTSRGGILAMAMAALRPASVGAAVLNDVGTVIERNGVARIMAYVGRVPIPNSWAEAARMALDMSREQFPTLTAADGDALARQWFNDLNGKPAPAYDPAIAKSLVMPDGPLPDLWKPFGVLARVPVLVLRGALSDLLSVDTVREMGRRHPDLQSHVVPNEGHAPMLRDAPTHAVIASFLARADTASVG